MKQEESHDQEVKESERERERVGSGAYRPLSSPPFHHCTSSMNTVAAVRRWAHLFRELMMEPRSRSSSTLLHVPLAHNIHTDVEEEEEDVSKKKIIIINKKKPLLLRYC